MTRILFSLLFVLSLSTTVYSQTKLKSKLIASSCDAGGRCTGSSYCTACSNCSRCKHCSQNGGSCGVCAGGSSASNFTSSSSGGNKSTKRKKNSSSSTTSRYSSAAYGLYDNDSTSTPANEEVSYDTVLTVITSILNVRSGPGKDYPVLVKLERGEYVRCIETTTADWVKVEVVGLSIEGYVYRKNLK